MLKVVYVSISVYFQNFPMDLDFLQGLVCNEKVQVSRQSCRNSQNFPIYRQVGVAAAGLLREIDVDVEKVEWRHHQEQAQGLQVDTGTNE